MGKAMWAVPGLVLAAGLGAGLLALSAGRPAAAADPPPAGPAAVPPLEAGKQYTFYWDRSELVGATALDAPRGNWVKVRYQTDAGKEAVHWVNLATVTHVVELPAGK